MSIYKLVLDTSIPEQVVEVQERLYLVDESGPARCGEPGP